MEFHNFSCDQTTKTVLECISTTLFRLATIFDHITLENDGISEYFLTDGNVLKGLSMIQI